MATKLTKNQEKAVRFVQVTFLLTLVKESLNSSPEYFNHTWNYALNAASRVAAEAGMDPKPGCRQSGINLVDGKVNVPWPPGVNKASEKVGKQAARALVKYL
jgi:hypothetical protein